MKAILATLSLVIALTGCGGADPFADGTASAATASESRARAACLTGSAPPSTQLPQLNSDLLFDWAERAYPQLFPGRSPSLRQAPYDYRYYAATGNHVGVSGEDVYILGPVSNNVLQHVGQRNTYRCQADPVSCGGPGYARAGWITALSQLQHGVSGDVSIVDARTLRFTNFNYDGAGPLTFTYLGAQDTHADFVRGPAVGTVLQSRRYVNETFEVQLPPGHSLDNFKAVSIWCVPFRANFGSGTFVPPTGAAGIGGVTF